MSGKLIDLKHVQRVRVLYKMILKLHRGLPEAMKSLGDLYAKEEFRRHKNCNAQEALIFMNEWTGYALNLSQQLGLKGPKHAKPLGHDLSEEELDKMREDQVQQLYELLLASKGKDEEADLSKNG
ncbi:succinate dehydrogenase assembly factor 3, mitochondrial [Ischnura elegans]|uniref:succinate dehydrogenase assembly factor 3, mitochondrial n=1 Tax=Ischnura elegans TaxID=197161 RepID=UPI001ED89384|nr:succinate dehydrogenase assembly factor 3, mitochondrial [Ischnura elegans]